MTEIRKHSTHTEFSAAEDAVVDYISSIIDQPRTGYYQFNKDLLVELTLFHVTVYGRCDEISSNYHNHLLTIDTTTGKVSTVWSFDPLVIKDEYYVSSLSDPEFEQILKLITAQC